MTRTIRPLVPADAAAVLALFESAGLHPNAQPQELQWKYWQPRADWPGPRAYVLEGGGALQAAGALVPGCCTFAGQRLPLIHVIDWAARTGAWGAGTVLMKHFATHAQALLAVGGSTQTLKILPQIGFKSLGAVTGFVRPLHPLRLRASPGNANWRLLPRMARSVAWMLAAPRSPGSEWRARQLRVAEVAQLAGVFPSPRPDLTVLERSVELFRYLLVCPIVPMALFALEQVGRVRGYFLLARAPGQVRLADCWVDSGELAAWRGALLCAVAAAQSDPQAAELVTWASDPLLQAALRACGFHPRFQFPLQVRIAPGLQLPQVPLRVQMIDNDAAYFHEGRPENWA